MAGASGFLGSRLAERLRADGHQVVRLVRRRATGADELSWHPAEGLEPAAVTGVDAVINLAGSPVGTNLGPLKLPVRIWTSRYREQFRASRVDTTTALATAIAAADRRPAVFLAASSVGWYGDTGETEVDEHAPPGEGYLADVARVWEAATGPAERAGVRVVRLRTGFPLYRDGGLLGPMILPFQLGLGGRIGSGRQWQPWISMVDWLEAAVFLLHRDDIAGPVNMVGPAPVRSIELTRALARELHRPAVLPIPGPLLRLLLNEFGTDVLVSKRVVPDVLQRAGFSFIHTDVRSAIRAALTAPAALRTPR